MAFYVRRLMKDGSPVIEGPLRYRSQAERNRDAWINSGISAYVIEAKNSRQAIREAERYEAER